MSKLDEEFEEHFRSIDSTDTLLTLRHEVAEYWFLAGAKAEHEAVLEIIQSGCERGGPCTWDFVQECFERRIREREDTNGS